MNDFATAINCIDGRTLEPVIKFMKERFGVKYVDMITEPGAVKVLREGKDRTAIESVKARVGLSVARHDTEAIVVVGHFGCLANPVDQEKHWAQIRTAVRVVRDWSLRATVYGLWVDEAGDIQTIVHGENGGYDEDLDR